ncbi:MAG: hypothetical protein HQK54_10855 [Oligoflexales bacterium]|nr:hypothetical protein [Oligoflexales bacterium]
MIYLTAETLKILCEQECRKHGVNCNYFYKKILNANPIPITREELLDLLDKLLADAFWNDYERMYEGIGYPEYTKKTAD